MRIDSGSRKLFMSFDIFILDLFSVVLLSFDLLSLLYRLSIIETPRFVGDIFRAIASVIPLTGEAPYESVTLMI